jgi:hypothetical protein
MKTRNKERHKSIPQILFDAIRADMRESRQEINRYRDTLKRKPELSPIIHKCLDMEINYLSYLTSQYLEMRDYYGNQEDD